MLGRKLNTIRGEFGERVRRIAQSKPYAPPGPIRFGKREPRAMSFKPGTLTFVGGEKLDIVVTNTSATGARVEFVRGAGLPERVLLSEPRSGLKKWAYVTWQTYGRAGLTFVGEKPATE